jgi:hypothetical protein
VSDLEREVKRLRQEVVKKSVAGTRRGAVAGLTSDNAQLEKFEKRLADEKSKLTSMREQSLKQVESRNVAVTQMIEASPEKVQREDGLIGRLAALHSLIIEKPSVLAVVIAIDLLLAALDCSGFIVRLCAPTSIYSAFVAKTNVLESVAQAKDCADRLAVYTKGPDESEEANETAKQGGRRATLPTGLATDRPMASNDNKAPPAGMNGATPRRGRGRPRKNGLDQSSRESDHD